LLGAGLGVALATTLMAIGRRRAPRRARAARAALAGAHLDAVAGPLAGKSFALAGASIALGSVGGNDIVVPDGAVSRHHCRFEPEPIGWVVVDAGATNGVWLNGRRVGKAVLVPGDRVRVGQSDFVFQAGLPGVNEGLADRL
jgi:hypothetical protein